MIGVYASYKICVAELHITTTNNNNAYTYM